MEKIVKQGGRYAMKAKKTSFFKGFAVSFFTASIALATMVAVKGLDGKMVKEITQTLHDAFFAVGAFCVLFSLLGYVKGEGAFIGVGYVFHVAFNALTSFGRKNTATYAKYRTEQEQTNIRLLQSGSFWVGIIFLLISLVILGIFFKI